MSLTTLTLTLSVDIIIQILNVFVKGIRLKVSGNWKFQYECFYKPDSFMKKSLFPIYTPSTLPSTIAVKGVVVNAKKRRKYLQKKRWSLGRSVHKTSYRAWKATVWLEYMEMIFASIS